METTLDYLTDVIVHQREVGAWMEKVIGDLRQRIQLHDNSKLMEPEFTIFAGNREQFKRVNFGTREYDEVSKTAEEAVKHHYRHNRHHTAHWRNGIDDMNLMDVIEMVCDWIAAARRSPDRSLADTLDQAFQKYGISEQLQAVIRNTLMGLGAVRDK